MISPLTKKIDFFLAEPTKELHLGAYLDELEHRFSNRHNEYMFRETLTKLSG